MLVQDKIFIAVFILSSLMVTGMIVENVNQAKHISPAAKKINVEEVKQKINEAGLTPHEAMYYKKL